MPGRCRGSTTPRSTKSFWPGRAGGPISSSVSGTPRACPPRRAHPGSPSTKPACCSDPYRPMRILVLNGSGGDGRAALVACRPDGLNLEHEAEQPGRGGAERLAGTVQGMLRHAGWDAGSLGLIVAVTGPGSFTGLRATLALAQGVALGAGVRLHGVSVSEALRRSVRESFSMPVWWVGAARRDRV